MAIAQFINDVEGAWKTIKYGIGQDMNQSGDNAREFTIKKLLLTTATDMGEAGVDDVYGVGMLNLDNATNPNGTSSISTISGTTDLNGTSLSASSAVGDSLSEIDVLSSTMIVDDYNRDYYVDLNQTISTNTNALTLDHNFMSFAGTEHVTMNGYTFAINDSDVNNIALGYQHNNCNYLVMLIIDHLTDRLSIHPL